MSNVTETNQTSNIRLLDNFYRIFLIMGIAFLTIGVPFVFYRKAASAVVCVIIIGAVAHAWRVNRQGFPQKSLKQFAVVFWLILVSLIFAGLPPVTAASATAVAVMLSVVVNLRAGIIFSSTCMFAWLIYIVLGFLGMAPAPYLVSKPLVSWFIGAFAIWLVLLPIPALVRNLRSALSLQRATLESTADGIVAVDNGGTITVHNRRFNEMWGIPSDVLVTMNDKTLRGRMAEQLKTPHSFEARINALYASPELSSQGDIEFGDGRVFACHSLPQWLGKEVVGRVWSFRDITAERTAQQAIGHLSRRNALLLDCVGEGIYGVDLLARASFMNKSATDMLGFTEEEVLGKNQHALFHHHRQDGTPHPEESSPIALTLNDGQARHSESEWFWRKDGSGFPVSLIVTPVIEDGERVGAVVSFQDITARKKAEAEIHSLAFYDSLTRLPNRRLLLDRLQHAQASSSRSRHHGALLFLDLDNFKTLNDSLGHDAGDLLLEEVGQRLVACVREADTVARLGGDEFVAMLEKLSDNRDVASAQAEAVGRKILAALNRPYLLDGHEHRSTPSIGITLFVAYSQSAATLLKQADLAMYQAKAAGRNTLCLFQPDDPTN